MKNQLLTTLIFSLSCSYASASILTDLTGESNSGGTSNNILDGGSNTNTGNASSGFGCDSNAFLSNTLDTSQYWAGKDRISDLNSGLIGMNAYTLVKLTKPVGYSTLVVSGNPDIHSYNVDAWATLYDANHPRITQLKSGTGVKASWVSGYAECNVTTKHQYFGVGFNLGFTGSASQEITKYLVIYNGYNLEWEFNINNLGVRVFADALSGFNDSNAADGSSATDTITDTTTDATTDDGGTGGVITDDTSDTTTDIITDTTTDTVTDTPQCDTYADLAYQTSIIGTDQADTINIGEYVFGETYINGVLGDDKYIIRSLPASSIDIVDLFGQNTLQLGMIKSSIENVELANNLLTIELNTGDTIQVKGVNNFKALVFANEFSLPSQLAQLKTALGL